MRSLLIPCLKALSDTELTPIGLCSDLTQMSEISTVWMRTGEFASYLGVHRITLGKMLRQGLLLEGIHRCKTNSLAPRGEFLWNKVTVSRTLRCP